MSKQKPLSNEVFLSHVRDYLSMDAHVWNTDERGKPGSCAIAGGMAENQFYRFNAEAVLSASHALEELALEEATGTLLATMPDFKMFEPHRERYWQLAATLEEVRVVAHGKKPRPHGHLRFIATSNRTLAPFWTVLYDGRHCHALLLCRETGGAKTFEAKKFDGFYTFNPAVIESVSQDIENILAGRASRMREFERLHAIDQTAKGIKVQFDREHSTVEKALVKLRFAAGRYQPRHFASDFEKSLNRLRSIVNRLPTLTVRTPTHD